ncbi:MAG TPA: hypothetical protein ENI39_01595 [Anaerolineae bacterium]|nr:hypothetical protein [Anaerolineae bacterium]
MIELLSILVLTFSLTLVLLGLITLWLERKPGRWQGIVVSLLGLLVGVGYAFLGSRFSLALFGRLIVRVNLPVLMATAVSYTVGVLGGIALAVGLFLWVTGRYHVWQIRRRVLALVLTAVLLAILLTFLAAWLSHSPT